MSYYAFELEGAREQIIEQAVAHCATPGTARIQMAWAIGCALDSWMEAHERHYENEYAARQAADNERAERREMDAYQQGKADGYDEGYREGEVKP